MGQSRGGCGKDRKSKPTKARKGEGNSVCLQIQMRRQIQIQSMSEVGSEHRNTNANSNLFVLSGNSKNDSPCSAYYLCSSLHANTQMCTWIQIQKWLEIQIQAIRNTNTVSRNTNTVSRNTNTVSRNTNKKGLEIQILWV